MHDDGLAIELVDPDPDIYRMAYNVISNATLWFCHHHLFDAARRPRSDHRWMEAWEAYRELNELFAQTVAKVAPEGRPGPRPGLPPGPDGFDPRPAPTRPAHGPLQSHPVRRPVGAADAADRGRDRVADRHGRLRRLRLPHGAVGRRLPAGTGAPPSRRGTARPKPGPTFVSPLSTDPDRLRSSAADPSVAVALARIEEQIGGPDRQVIVRVDRMELSKNLLRGFWAFEELLERQPQRRERVVFVALAYPTRQGLPEYLAYQNEVESTVARINQQWATPGWTPIVLEVEDDYQRSLAALSRYDVLLVNPVRDGLNLVAKEGPLDQHPPRGAGPVPRGRGLRRTGTGRAGDQPVRRVGHRGGAGRGARHGRGTTGVPVRRAPRS